MIDYSKSKIYKITNKKLDKCYIGATTQCVKKRFLQHRQKAQNKSTSSYILFLDHDIEDIELEVLEEPNCKNKQELLEIERKYIKNTDCINIQVPLRNYKEWYEDNIQINRLKSRLYHSQHKEAICLKKREKYKLIKDEILKPIYCECGCKTSSHHYKRHLQTQRHKDNLIKLAGNNEI